MNSYVGGVIGFSTNEVSKQQKSMRFLRVYVDDNLFSYRFYNNRRVHVTLLDTKIYALAYFPIFDKIIAFFTIWCWIGRITRTHTHSTCSQIAFLRAIFNVCGVVASW